MLSLLQQVNLYRVIQNDYGKWQAIKFLTSHYRFEQVIVIDTSADTMLYSKNLILRPQRTTFWCLRIN